MRVSEQNLLQLLETNPEYRRHYAKYKAVVEKRSLPRKLLKALPREIAFELERIWLEEREKILKNHA